MDPQTGAQGDMKAIGHESNEDVGLDAIFALMIDGAQVQVVLEVFEGGFNFGQLDVEAPQLRWIAATEVGPQQVTAFAAAGGAKFGPVEPVVEGSRRL